MKIDEIIKIIEKYFPLKDQTEWDNSGIQFAIDKNKKIRKAFFCVNPSLKNVEEAIKVNADLIFTHHPLIFVGLKSITDKTTQGKIVKKLFDNKVFLYSAHTSADAGPKYGVSSSMLDVLGVKSQKYIDAENKIGRYGTLVKQITLKKLLEKLQNLLPKTTEGILYTGPKTKKINRIAYCGGAGDHIMNLIAKTKADVYITADLRFHPAESFVNNNPNISLINLNHSASEYLWLKMFAKQFEKDTKVKVIVSENIDNVWDGIV